MGWTSKTVSQLQPKDRKPEWVMSELLEIKAWGGDLEFSQGGKRDLDLEARTWDWLAPALKGEQTKQLSRCLPRAEDRMKPATSLSEWHRSPLPQYLREAGSSQAESRHLSLLRAPSSRRSTREQTPPQTKHGKTANETASENRKLLKREFQRLFLAKPLSGRKVLKKKKDK